MNLAVDDANACGASIEELRLLDCMTMCGEDDMDLVMRSGGPLLAPAMPGEGGIEWLLSKIKIT
jgi:hypothetical protein